MNEGMNVGVVERVLDDTRMGRQSRARLLKRAAVGVAGATALGGLGAGSAFASGGDSIQTVGVTAATAEALAVTYLHNVLERNERVHAFPRPVVEILRAAGAEELDHFKFLTGAGFKPLTTRFWLPDDFFGRRLANVPATIEVAETLFVNAYLIGITVFANAHQATLARYAGEILGVEAEHRALARSLQGKLPNNAAFESFIYHDLAGVVDALEKAGVGFGKQGSKPGNFYTFRGMGDELIHVDNPKPM